MIAALLAFPAGSAFPASIHSADRRVPHYDHVVVIVEENRSYARIIENPDAPGITALAHAYGNATHMYGEVHLSQGNYVAMIAGTTLGIHDDDGWYCEPFMRSGFCSNSATFGYVAHHTAAIPNLMDQLQTQHKTWRGYFGSLPQPGSTAIISPADAHHPAALYAAKHNPFNEIDTLRTAPNYALNTVPLENFTQDLQKNALPNFAFVVPNQCDEMHGLHAGPLVDPSCSKTSSLIARGDRVATTLVAAIQRSPLWQSTQRVAVIITWDEDDRSTTGLQGCCGYSPQSIGNFGGGHIPTVVITNHGKRHVVDGTPYNHYSLLRTLDDAFGLSTFPGLSAGWDQHVRPMWPLFIDASQ